jgi:hypothetical protein
VSKQPLILAIAGLLETSPSQTEDIAIYGARITSILSHYDFTFADSLAAAEALADALSIEEEAEQEEQSPPALVDLTAGSLTPFPAPAPHWECVPEHDLRFARGEDHVADNWHHVPAGHITSSVVGSGASTAASELNVPQVLYLLPSPRINILRDTPLMQLTRQNDLSDIPYQGEEEETL